MKRIHVLTKRGSGKAIAFYLPLQLHRSLLREARLDVRLFFAVSPGIYDCDALFVARAYFPEPWTGLTDEVSSLLARARDAGCRTLWFDTSGSSGTTQFEVLPLVDLYCKSQLLADRSLYLRHFSGGRIFTDYFAKEMGLQGRADETSRDALPRPEDLSKIRSSWSKAMGDYGERAGLFRRLGRLAPAFGRYSARFVSPDRRRIRDISCRLAVGHLRPELRHHRERIKQALERDFAVETTPIPRPEFLRELGESRIGISPFGFGEICFRDFEIILAGAALVKPDMTHIDSWPLVFVPGGTYLSHRWDLADLRERLDELLAGRRWREIALEAQRVYHRYLFERAGHEEFCERVASLVDS